MERFSQIYRFLASMFTFKAIQDGENSQAGLRNKRSKEGKRTKLQLLSNFIRKQRSSKDQEVPNNAAPARTRAQILRKFTRNRRESLKNVVDGDESNPKLHKTRLQIIKKQAKNMKFEVPDVKITRPDIGGVSKLGSRLAGLLPVQIGSRRGRYQPANIDDSSGETHIILNGV